MSNLHTQLYNILAEISRCYKERKAENIVEFAGLLFDNNTDPVIIGASTNEWRYGIDGAKQIFLSDWKNWGNVILKSDSIVFDNVGKYAWFHVKAQVEFKFFDNEATYKGVTEIVTKMAGKNKMPLAKAGEITWLLSLLLHTREHKARKYLLDMKISCILECIDDTYKVMTMQFALPVLSQFSNVRIDIDKGDKDNFIEERNKIQKYNEEHPTNTTHIKKQLIAFFNKNSSIKYFKDDKTRYIGTDGNARNADSFKKYMNEFLLNKNVDLKLANIILDSAGKDFHFCGVGAITKPTDLNNDLQSIFDNIEYYNNIAIRKDGLFMLRRDLTQVLKESTYDTCTESFRVEGVGSFDDMWGLTLSYLQISYPRNRTPEGMIDI